MHVAGPEWRVSATSRDTGQHPRLRVSSARTYTNSPRATGYPPGLEVHGEIQPHEPRRVDCRRVVPRAAVQRVADAVLIGVLPGRRVVGVEQVPHIHPDVRASRAEAEDLREAHIDLRAALAAEE